MENKDKIYQLLTNKFTPAAACGIMANIQRESSYNPTTMGDSGTSYGLCQWHNSRWTALKNYAAERGLAVDAIETQIDFMLYEMQKSYKSVYSACANAGNTSDDAYNVAYTMCVKYEIPAKAEEKGVQRGEIARELFTAYTTPQNKSDGVTMTTLRNGSRGTHVLVMQFLLKQYGHNVGTLDGVFGNKTLTALKEYQQANGLTVDGICGKKTWGKLLA